MLEGFGLDAMDGGEIHLLFRYRRSPLSEAAQRVFLIVKTR